MNLSEYLADSQSKYAVIGANNYDIDPVAKGISDSPRRFALGGIDYVILSLDPVAVPLLVGYIEQSGVGVEFEFIQGSGKVSLLQHQQALELLATLEQVE